MSTLRELEAYRLSVDVVPNRIWKYLEEEFNTVTESAKMFQTISSKDAQQGTVTDDMVHLAIRIKARAKAANDDEVAKMKTSEVRRYINAHRARLFLDGPGNKAFLAAIGQAQTAKGLDDIKGNA